MAFFKKKTVVPHNEAERLAMLRSLEVLDSTPDVRFTDLVDLAAQVIEVPISVLSLIDKDRQWFKAKHGLDVNETPREVAFCAHTILNQKDVPFIVEDALEHDDFKENPLVTGELGIRFYAGFPLVLHGGFAVGSLCVIDQKPRKISRAQLDVLQKISDIAIRRLESLSPELRSQALELWFKRTV